VQPSNKSALTEKSGALLIRTVKNVVEARRQRHASRLNLPETLGIKLTNRCNLRCAHCYQWNESGYHRDMGRTEQNLDLDIGVFRRLLEETRPVKSRLYLWGGEPLVHREIDHILKLLEQDPRETTICTNAHFIGKHVDALCQISENLELLIAVEGFEAEHDALRGNGSFNKVMGAVDALLELRAAGIFKGRLSIHTVISDKMVGRFHDLMQFYERKGIDLVLLCFPWYISDETSREMDAFVLDKFDWLIDVGKERHSWDAFKYRLSPERIDLLMADLRSINSRTWSNRIRYQPGLEFDEIEGFVRGKSMTARCATKCRVLDTRADITPTGTVTACKFFAEFSVGNLHDQPLSALWQSEQYTRIRQILGQQLSPACSKCNVLYLHEHSTPLHI
jgi:radical SAM protein with 4Fe4S-binding SPASM domain